MDVLRLDARGEAVLFGLLVLACSYATSTVAALEGAWPWTPAFAAVVVLLISRGLHVPAWTRLGLFRTGWRAWLPACLLPLAVLGGSAGLAASAGLVRIHPGAGAAGREGGELAVAILGAVVGGSLWAIGEELGWRGFLLPRLAGLGRSGAGLLGGGLWVAWHVASEGVDAEDFAPFAATILALAFIANELRATTGSVWPAAILHGSHDAALAILGLEATQSAGTLPALAGDSGLVTVGLYAIVALAIVALGRPWGRLWTRPRDPWTLKSVPPQLTGR